MFFLGGGYNGSFATGLSELKNSIAYGKAQAAAFTAEEKRKKLEANPCVILSDFGPWAQVENEPGKFVRTKQFRGECALAGEELSQTKQDCVGAWSTWDDSKCLTTGKMSRNYVVAKENSANGACPSPRQESTICGEKKDCVVSEWSAWGPCDPQSVTHTRTRTILTPASGGGSCNSLIEIQPCFENCKGEWGPWTPSPCTDPAAMQTSMYNIISRKIGTGADCPYTGGLTQTRSCAAPPSATPSPSPSETPEASPSPSQPSPSPAPNTPWYENPVYLSIGGLFFFLIILKLAGVL